MGVWKRRPKVGDKVTVDASGSQYGVCVITKIERDHCYLDNRAYPKKGTTLNGTDYGHLDYLTLVEAAHKITLNTRKRY